MVLAVVQWDRANQIAIAASALAAVAAVGVAISAALPGISPTIRVTGTGRAVAGSGGRANTGLAGPAADLGTRVEVEDTSDADASGGGREYRRPAELNARC